MQLYFERDIAPASLPHAEYPDNNSFSGVKKSVDKPKQKPSAYETILIDIGSSHRAAVNHIIGALVDRTALLVSDVGKVDVFPEQTVVEIPAGRGDEVVDALAGCIICGKPVSAEKLAVPYKKARSGPHADTKKYTDNARASFSQKKSYRTHS
jgi:ATP-dependent RNA helicase DeaD